MSKFARRLLFLAFALFFLTAAPLIVLYTAGYRYSPRSGLVLQTGVLSVQTIPRGASIAIDQTQIQKTTPFVVKRIVPGNYTVKLERKDYLPWESEIAIKPGATTFLQNILLLRDNPAALLAALDIESPKISPIKSHLIATSTANDWQEVRLINLQNNAEKIITRNPLTTDLVLDYAWSSDGLYFALQTTTGNVSVYTSEGIALELPESNEHKHSSFTWHPSIGNILYSTSENALYEWVISTNAMTITKIEQPQIAISETSSLRFIDNGNETELREISINESRLIALLPRGDYQILKQDESFLLIQKAGGNLLLLHSGTSQPLLLSTDAQIFDWQTEQNILAYSNGNEVNIYRPSAHQITFLTRISEEIHALAWHPTTQYVFFATENHIEALEIYKNSKDRKRITLAEMDQIDAMWLSTNGKTLFILGAKGEEKGLFARQLTR
jgi:hypothetical protein